MLADGYTALLPGKLAALVTYLSRDMATPLEAARLPPGIRLHRLGAGDVARYLALFRAVGQDWLWFSRLRLGPGAIADILGAPCVHAYALADANGDIGLVELDLCNGEAPMLAYFGLVPAAVGKGLGMALMVEALTIARRSGARRLDVHTCSLDHPRALAFYVRSGFVPKSRAVEVFDDPRLDGTLPRSAAAFMPVIEV